MNRHERRRRLKVGDVIHAHTAICPVTGKYFWFSGPVDRTGFPTTMHGPFNTQAEVDEHQRLTLLGPQCKVTDVPALNRMH
jgi:hypothetical protein